MNSTLRVSVEVLIKGEVPQRVGAMFITANDRGEGDRVSYDIRIMKHGDYQTAPGVWRQGRVNYFPRLDRGCWELTLVALAGLIADRVTGQGIQAVLEDLAPKPATPGTVPCHNSS